MNERENDLQNTDSLLSLEKDLAKEQLEAAFQLDPLLTMRVGDTMYWDLSITHTNETRYKNGETSSICTYFVPGENEILISQLFPQLKGGLLRIFLSEGKPSIYYTSKPMNWNESPKGVFRDVELPYKKVDGGIERVEAVLESTKAYIELFLLYQKYFVNSKKSLNVPRERISSRKIKKKNLEYLHFERTLRMINQIQNGERELKFNNYEGNRLPLYDHMPFVRHEVHM